MKRTLKNYEIEKIVTVLNHQESFMNNLSIKLPRSVIHALRVNMKYIKDRYEIYAEERKEILTKCISDGKASTTEDGGLKFTSDSDAKAILSELEELAGTDNTFDFEDIRRDAFNELNCSALEDEAIELMLGSEHAD